MGCIKEKSSAQHVFFIVEEKLLRTLSYGPLRQASVGQGDALLLLTTAPNALLHLTSYLFPGKNCGVRLSCQVAHYISDRHTRVWGQSWAETDNSKSLIQGLHKADLECAIRFTQIFITFPLKGAIENIILWKLTFKAVTSGRIIFLWYFILNSMKTCTTVQMFWGL